QPWYAIATPHEDIRKGQLAEAVFAANLWTVAQAAAGDVPRENVPEVYLDPDIFFKKSFLTAGLRNMLTRVGKSLAGASDSGDRIISLQTSFGGGKTHMLIALWHLAKSADVIRKAAAFKELRAVIGDELPKKPCNVAVFTHQTCDATQGRKTKAGVHTHTLWGELAFQLGGKELYDQIAANDQARTVPQGLFTEILRQATPCLILIDELADYCVGAAAVNVGNTTLADQTVSFVQQLTQAVSDVKGAVVVATLPASHLEVAGSEKGQEILQGLEKRFGRMGADLKPVADDEIFEVVRRRLFQDLGERAEHEKIAAAYLAMYRQHEKELPSDATKATYKERLISAYPFHPELIDALYLRWGSHNDFQRTRGVLRLLASIVGDLWQRRESNTQAQWLIQPPHIRWTIDALQSALTSAILLGSFGGQGDRAGYSSKDLKLVCSRPALNWNYTDGALLELENRGFFLHTASAGNLGKRYWFGVKPTLNKLILQYRQSFETQDFDSAIRDQVEQQAGLTKLGAATWRVLTDPANDLPEQKSLALLILSPTFAFSEETQSAIEKKILDLSHKCGERERHFRNTLLFLAPSPRGLNRLRQALREETTLDAVQRDYKSQLDAEQAGELVERLKTARASVRETLGSAYTVAARVEGQKVVTVALTDAKKDFGEHLQLVWKTLVEEEEWILKKVGPVTLQKAGLTPTEGGIRLSDAIEAFMRYTDKPMIASRDAVTQGLSQACKERYIGIGRGLRADNLSKRWCGEAIALDPGEEGVWIVPPFTEEPLAQPQPPAGSEKPGTPTAGAINIQEDGTQPPVFGQPPTLPIARAGKVIKKIVIRGAVPPESWSDLFRSFVSPAARMRLKHLRLGIQFELESTADQPLSEDDPTIKAMQESAQQLSLDLNFEE
ncbi:MAG: ATP-binding protein, partial [Chloroflexi bacterium]|nr:ATP-binding protein [Chloroflexota bacterium]